jgi:hypothetical protein
VKATLEVREQHRHRLDPLLVGQVLQPLVADFISRNAIGAVSLGFQVLLFQLTVRKS